MVFQEQKRLGVIAASAGNHALALAYHGQQLGIPVTVCMPINAPITKVSQCRKYGATVHLVGADLIEAKEFGSTIAAKERLVYINGYVNTLTRKIYSLGIYGNVPFISNLFFMCIFIS